MSRRPPKADDPRMTAEERQRMRDAWTAWKARRGEPTGWRRQTNLAKNHAANQTIQAMIRRTKTGFKVTSKTHNKNLGTFQAKAQAENRLRQVEYFKHLKKTGRK